MRKLFAVIILTFSAVVAPPAAPAEAAFSNCNWTIGWANRSASVQCWRNTGPVWASYRVVLYCSRYGERFRAYGPWRTAGGWSSAQCGNSLSFQGYFMQTMG